MEIIDFRGQTAPASKLVNANYVKYHILKTNHSTISALIVKQFWKVERGILFD